MRALMFLIAALFAVATPAAAEDYRFTVPVRIENMRFAENVRVSCTAVMNVSGINRAVTGQTPVTLSSGGFRGTVTVSVTLPPGVSRADYGFSACELTYTWHNADGTADRGGYIDQTSRNAGYTRGTGQVVDQSQSWRSVPP